MFFLNAIYIKRTVIHYSVFNLIILFIYNSISESEGLGSIVREIATPVSPLVTGPTPSDTIQTNHHNNNKNDNKNNNNSMLSSSSSLSVMAVLDCNPLLILEGLNAFFIRPNVQDSTHSTSTITATSTSTCNQSTSSSTSSFSDSNVRKCTPYNAILIELASNLMTNIYKKCNNTPNNIFNESYEKLSSIVSSISKSLRYATLHDTYDYKSVRYTFI